MITMKTAAVAGLVVMAGALASPRQAAPQADVLPALLQEVRGLRAAMEQVATAGPRVQLFTSRLQLEETRINNMIQRLNTVRNAQASAQTNLADIEDQVRRHEAAVKAERGTPRERDDEGLAAVLEHEKREAATAKGTVDRYRAEEMQLTADIAIEQTRWSDINNRLDELERLLAKRQ